MRFDIVQIAQFFFDFKFKKYIDKCLNICLNMLIIIKRMFKCSFINGGNISDSVSV